MMESGEVCPDCGEVHDDTPISEEEFHQRLHTVSQALNGLSVDDCYMILGMVAADILRGIPSDERGEMRIELNEALDQYTRGAASDA